MPRYILNHPEWGVFVGEFIGLGFWTQLDSVEQTEVVTFRDIETANLYMKMLHPSPCDQVQVIEVDTDAVYATELQCVTVGAKPWTKK